MKPVAIVLNTSWNIYNFRLNIVCGLQEAGYDVVTIAPNDKWTGKLIEMGCQHYHINLSSSSFNPLVDLKYAFDLNRIINKVKPCAILNYTAKPNIYGSLVARKHKIKVINNIAGLGSGFVGNSPIKIILKLLYRIAFSKADFLFFQNSDDCRYFISEKIAKESKSYVVPGSGVDLDKFLCKPMPPVLDGRFRFLFVARMLRSKGVIELLEATKQLNSEFPGRIHLTMLGTLAADNRDVIGQEVLNAYINHSYIEYFGHVADVKPFIEECHCIVLPTYYREGVPRSLLEAMAIGRIIITTNMPGCKETVSGQNGFLVRPKDKRNLLSIMRRVMLMRQEELDKMGLASRKYAEEKFSSDFVTNKYLEAVNA